MKLPPEAAKPWCWSPWWGNTLRLGNEIGKDFETGLLSASAEAGSTTLNLRARVGGHRPTSFAAIGLLLRAVVAVDLRDNRLNDEEAALVAEAFTRTEQLTKLNMAGNRIRSSGAAAIGRALETSSRRARTVTEIDFSRNPMCLPDPKAPKDGESKPYDGLLEIARAIAVCPMILGECY
jgi:hypothetical protein